MSRKVHVSENAPAPIGPYSQAVEVNGMLYCSGQIALDPKKGEMVTGGVVEEAKQVMKNIEAVLKAADLGFSHIVKTTIFLLDMGDFPKVNEVYGQFFAKQPPARSTIAVAALPKGAKVEIEVVAAR